MAKKSTPVAAPAPAPACGEKAADLANSKNTAAAARKASGPARKIALTSPEAAAIAEAAGAALPKVLTSQDQIADATMADLLLTYQKLSGKAVKRFADRATAERRVTDALMGSADTNGHLGVPKGAKPAPAPMADLVQKAADTGRADPAEMVADAKAPAAGVEVDPKVNPYQPGTLAHRTWAKAEGAPVPPTPAPKAPAAQTGTSPAQPRKTRATSGWVRYAGPGDSKPQATSVRGQVLAFVKAAEGKPVRVADIEAKFPGQANGCIGKLLSHGQFEVCGAPDAD